MKQITFEEEYKKKNGINPQDIAALRQWLKTQPHLPEPYITDLDLILAFHSCDCSTGLTKQVLDLNFTLRSLFGFFKDRTVNARIEQTANSILVTPLLQSTRDGYRIFFTHLLNADPKLFIFEEYVKSMLMCLDILQLEEGTWPGVVLVIDYEYFSLSHLAKIDLFGIQQVLYYLQNAIPIKLKGLHFINAPSFIDKVLMLMKPFLKKDLMDMLHIHTKGSNTLENFVPLEFLPKQSGGNSQTYEEYRDEMLNKLRDHKDYFEADKHRRVIESLRPGKPKTITDIFGGIEGSFKKLDID